MSNFESAPKVEFYRTIKPLARYCHVRENVDILEQLTLIPDGSSSEFLQHTRLFESLPSILQSAHGLLVKIANEVSWEKLLEMRNAVFVMESSEEMVNLNAEQKRLCEKWLDDLFLVLCIHLDVV